MVFVYMQCIKRLSRSRDNSNSNGNNSNGNTYYNTYNWNIFNGECILIQVIYKNWKGQTFQIPFNNITHAKKKADELKKKYIGVKVVKVKEEILYIP